MPNVLIPLENTHDSITRRVVSSVVRNVMRITGIPDTTQIHLFGSTEQAVQPGSFATERINRVEYQHDGLVTVTAREAYRESEVINSPVRYPDAQAMFKDQSLGVFFAPVYSYTDLEISFTYRAKSKSQAAKWRDDIKVRLGDDRSVHLHKLDYHYPVPKVVIGLLLHFYQLREAQAGYGDTLGEWLKEHFNPNATTIATSDGSIDRTLLVIGEKQVGIQGWFGFTEPEEAAAADTGPGWNISMVYHAPYQKPVEVHGVYPQMIHQQLIDDRVMVPFYQDDPDLMPTFKGSLKDSYDNMDYRARRVLPKIGGIRIPDNDEWIPASVRPYTSSLVNWAISIEAKDTHLFLGEADVLDTGFHPEILAFMKKYAERLTRFGHAPIYINNYSDLEPIDQSDTYSVETENGFEIRSRVGADMRQRYHTRLSFITRWEMLTDQGKELLHLNGKVALRLFQSVVNDLDVEDALENEVDEEGRINYPYLERFYRYLKNKTPTYVTDQSDEAKGHVYNPDDPDSYYRYRGEWPLVNVLTIAVGKEK